MRIVLGRRKLGRNSHMLSTSDRYRVKMVNGQNEYFLGDKWSKSTGKGHHVAARVITLMNAANSQNVIFAAVNSGGNSHMFSASSCDNNTHSFHYHFVIQVCIMESLSPLS